MRVMFWLECLTLYNQLTMYSVPSDTGDYKFKDQITAKQYSWFFFFISLKDLMQKKSFCKWHCNEWVSQHNFCFETPSGRTKRFYNAKTRFFFHETFNICPATPDVSFYLLKFWMETLNSLVFTINPLFSWWAL